MDIFLSVLYFDKEYAAQSGFGLIDPNTFTPYPKNPVIAHFFQQIGRADELGSGTLKLMKYGKSYGGAYPELIEGDVFRTIIKVPDSNIYPTEFETLRPESGLESGLAARVYIALRENPLGRAEIAKHLGHQSVSSALHKQVKRLLHMGYIEMARP